ncbi:hypothetical protein [Clostridium taeniosporum]|uniref:Uncharacterized protein n=1 Tax=Clostridium taeniosporum TaxID=394958 RepID=A0A1D7XLP7_9CLOT|nr:hypothetical protein [Clostridium taeniosporum]AOR24029.1 hypothetical protein BGI42_09930 [Clostridium taeniosporum]
MIQIDIEFMHKVLDDKIEIQELINMEVELRNIKYNYVENINRSVIITGEIIFDIEYIPKGELEIRNLEIVKRISKLVNLDNSIFYKENNIENTEIVSKGFRLIEGNTIFINISINMIMNKNKYKNFDSCIL